MKPLTLYVTSGLLITLILLQPARVHSSRQYQLDFNQWVDRLRELLRWRPKRECIGYMCSYHHMGSAAASRSKHRSLMRFLQSCAMDPMCSPGKRRKRSISSTLPTTSQRLSRSARFDPTHSFSLKNLFPRIYLTRNRKENIKALNVE